MSVDARFDESIHAPTRLRLCALLLATGTAEFSSIASLLELSEATLSKTIRNLADLGYVQKTNDKTSELYEWMGRVFIAFRELEVRLLLGEPAPQLKYSASLLNAPRR